MAETNLTSDKLDGNRKGFFRKREEHGMTGTKILGIYDAMLARCYNRNTPSFPRYGGRGITVCDRWYESFAAFYADMGDPPEGHQIDRIDNSMGYSPENCRWVTVKQNCRNRRSNVLLDFRGERLTLAELSERTGIKQHTIAWRIRRGGMSVEEAATTPVESQINYITLNGAQVRVIDMAKKLGVKADTILYRINKLGMTPEQAVSVPSKKRAR